MSFRSVGRLWLAASFLLLWSERCAAVEEQWFAVFVDAQQVGHMQTEREVVGDRVHSRQTLALALGRDGVPLHVRSHEANEETLDGLPLRFVAELDTAGTSMRIAGTIADDALHVETRQGDVVRTETLPWPAGALLAEGQRLAARRAGYAPGARHRVQAFTPAALSAVSVASVVAGAGDGDDAGLVRVVQTIGAPDRGVQTESWVDPASGNIRRMRLPSMGLLLEMRACSRACATAQTAVADVLASTLVQAPRALSAAERRRPLRYTLAADADVPLALDDQPGQSLHALDDGRVVLAVDPAGEALSPPSPQDTAANRWLQSDAGEIRALAAAAAGAKTDPAAQMEALEAFVRRHIAVKSLRIGYASAQEVATLREGDCTEHAVLLAALARARGIPARVATGVAYTPRFGERRHVFVPHAWVYAWTGERWQGFDAALARFDASHIAFGSGDGDPFAFYQGQSLQGRLQIERVERLPRRARADALAAEDVR